MNFKIVYKISLKKLLKSTMTYVVLVVSLFISAFVMIFVPLVGTHMDISRYYDSDSWTLTVCQGTFAIFALTAAAIGETNALSSEKIYFLSKPIKRSTFLWAKCLSTLTIALSISILCLLILAGIAIFEAAHWDKNIFSNKLCVNPFGLFASWLSIILFSSFVSTLWKYQTRGGVWIALCFAIVLIYVIIYPMYTDITDSDFSRTEKFWWLMLPVCMYLPIGVGLSYIGMCMFIKSEIES